MIVERTDGMNQVTNFKELETPRKLDRILPPQIYSGMVTLDDGRIVEVFWNSMGKCSNDDLPQYFIQNALGIKETIKYEEMFKLEDELKYIIAKNVGFSEYIENNKTFRKYDADDDYIIDLCAEYFKKEIALYISLIVEATNLHGKTVKNSLAIYDDFTRRAKHTIDYHNKKYNV